MRFDTKTTSTGGYFQEDFVERITDAKKMKAIPAFDCKVIIDKATGRELHFIVLTWDYPIFYEGTLIYPFTSTTKYTLFEKEVPAKDEDVISIIKQSYEDLGDGIKKAKEITNPFLPSVESISDDAISQYLPLIQETLSVYEEK